jgi:hypothetical protein
MFDVQAVLDGAWDDTAFYRRGDQRGTLQEVTPTKTREALTVLDGRRPVVTYNLGGALFNGMPAFPSAPPRVYDQRLLILGYEPPPGSEGILQSPALDLPARGALAGLAPTRDRRRRQLGARGRRPPRRRKQCLSRPPELITHHGIRIGEAIVTDQLAEDRVYEFVYIVTPQLALGATAGSAPPCALGQPR